MTLMYQANNSYTIPNTQGYAQYQVSVPTAYVAVQPVATPTVTTMPINSYPLNYYMPITNSQNTQTHPHKCNAGGSINITITNPSVYGQNNNLKDKIEKSEENPSKTPIIAEEKTPQEEEMEILSNNAPNKENFIKEETIQQQKPIEEIKKEPKNPIENKNLVEKINYEQPNITNTQKIIQETQTITSSKEPETQTKLQNIYLSNLNERLSNTNEQIRITAIKEIMAKFRDEKNLQNNKDLISLLNKAIDDKNNVVRFFAMATVASGYTPGDDVTRKKLDSVQYQKTSYNEDAILASEALIKIASFNNPQNTQTP